MSNVENLRKEEERLMQKESNELGMSDMYFDEGNKEKSDYWDKKASKTAEQIIRVRSKLSKLL